MEKCIKESFVVIGKEGSTEDGAGFIQKLWADANDNYDEIAGLVKTGESGRPLGFWGAMSDFSRGFSPWEEGFAKGLYLAGAECLGESTAPDGWVKWVIPGYEYIFVENAHDRTFQSTIEYMEANNLPLAGAAHDFICPETGKSYIFFPIRKL